MTAPKTPTPLRACDEHTRRPSQVWAIDHTELPVWIGIPSDPRADATSGPVTFHYPSHLDRQED